MNSLENEICDTLDDVIQKQHLIKLKTQIAKRDALLDGVSVYVHLIGFDTRYGDIYVKWNDKSDARVLDRYCKYYSPHFW
jgi:hypothetical protein